MDEARDEWYNIGTELNLSVQLLETIKLKHFSDRDSLKEMCSEWLRRIDLHPSWAALTMALESHFVQKTHLAQELRDKYCHGNDEVVTDICSIPGPSPDGVPPMSQGSYLIVLFHTLTNDGRQYSTCSGL